MSTAPLTRPLLWLLLGLSMLAVPLSMIIRKEYALAHGQDIRLRLAPIDPSDPFRGRYMNLSFAIERPSYTVPPEASDDSSQTKRPVYAFLTLDTEGYASVSSLTAKKPTEGLYLRVEILPYSDRIRVPFNRFFLNEEAAPALEKQAAELLRKASAEGKEAPVYATVRLHEGEGVILELVGPEGPLTASAKDW